eukprot:jgi/Botrbrau1/11527/Bobra.0393s0006.1
MMVETSYIDMENEETMWTRNFDFNGLHLRVEEEWGLGIGGTVWEGGVLLASFVSSSEFPAEHVKGGRCLEIGAGVTGLPSLTAFHRGVFKEVVITDIEECMGALIQNVKANLPDGVELRTKWTGELPPPRRRSLDLSGPLTSRSRTPPPFGAPPGQSGWDLPATVVATVASEMANRLHLREEPSEHEASRQPLAAPPPPPHSHYVLSGEEEVPEGAPPWLTGWAGHLMGDLRVEELDWQQDPAFLDPPFEVLLIADVVYIADLMEPLLKCMAALCTPDTLVYLAYYERSAAATKEFWRLLPLYFSWEKIDEKGYGASEHGQDVGLFRLRLVENPGAPLETEATNDDSSAASTDAQATPGNIGTPLQTSEAEKVS